MIKIPVSNLHRWYLNEIYLPLKPQTLLHFTPKTHNNISSSVTLSPSLSSIAATHARRTQPGLRHISFDASDVKDERDAQVREVHERAMRVEDVARSAMWWFPVLYFRSN